jgi:hypothetical protein
MAAARWTRCRNRQDHDGYAAGGAGPASYPLKRKENYFPLA